MKLLIWLSVFGVLLHFAESYFYVTAPNVIRFELDEKIVIGVLEENNKKIEVWLELDEGVKFSYHEVTIEDQTKPVERTIRVSEKNISEKWKRNPDSVTLVAKKDGQEKRTKIVLSYRTGHLVVQTDKPVYTPRQKVKVRVLAMTEQFNPADRMNVSVDIVSPNNITFARYFHQPNDGKNTELSYFFQHEFELPPLADTGIWTIKAFFRGQYKTDGRALFAVEKYVLPTFAVSIETGTNYILPDSNDSINITVKAEYVYKEPVEGTVQLELSAVQSTTGDKETIINTRGDLLNHHGERRFTISKDDICLRYLKACDNEKFPEGFRLHILARVTEDATGNQESALDESIIFAKTKYQVSFDRTKSTYRHSMSYVLKLDVRYANGEVADNKVIQVDMVYDNTPHDQKSATTKDNGQVNVLFDSLPENKDVEFRVRVYDCAECPVAGGETFQIKPFLGNKQIIVEHLETGGVEFLRAYTNGNNKEDTGLLYMIVSNGHIIHTEFKVIGTMQSITLDHNIKRKINSPSARLLVVYINKDTGKLIADSEKFFKDIHCKGNGLSLKEELANVEPGAKSRLTIEGEPDMYVGLNIMDSALLHVPNRAEIISKQTMLDIMDEHDTGCGQGSGQTGEAVLRNTGLTMLTDAITQPNELERKGVNCGNINNRRKRNTDECPADKVCCDLARTFAKKQNDTKWNGDPFTTCLSKVMEKKVELTSKGELVWPTKCLIAFFKTCVYTLEESLSSNDNDGLQGKSLNSVNRYTALLSQLEDLGLYRGTNFVRSNFAESWEFDIKQLGREGEIKLSLSYPDSITTWLIQAIGITKDKGFCVAETAEVRTFRDFFLQVDLPYKAVRLEQMDIKATIFNYGSEQIPANIFLDHSSDYCSNSGSDRPMMIEVNLKPRSAQTVMFPILPLRAGKFEVTVRAISFINSNVKTDGVKKHLYVENEGVEVKEVIQVCLDPMKQRDDCQNSKKVTDTDHSTTQDAQQKQTSIVDLTLPENHIPGTATALGRLSTNVMQEVVSILVNGVEKLFIQPMGCGEQTVIRLAPNVYAMEYLKNTGQVTSDIETRGHQFIQSGVQRELTYKRSDGAYAAWLSRPGSTWLSAFVAKVFCQAGKVDSTVRPLIDPELPATLSWILTQKNNDGSFFDRSPVIHREMIGLLKEQDPSLTAFVVTALAECSYIQLPEANQSLVMATNYLSRLDKGMLRNNPYLLAISTYALALANHKDRWAFRDMLLDTKKELQNTGYFWGSIDGPPASAATVETTSYALLSMLLFDDFATSAHIVRWLTAQRNAEGSFRTTQDTVVGLQALSAYSIKTYNPNVNLKINVGYPGLNGGVEKTLSAEQSQVVSTYVIEQINKGDNSMIVSVTGTGTGMLTLDLRYNRPRRKEETCRVSLSNVESTPVDESVDQAVAAQLDKECDICGNCKGDPQNPDYENLGEEIAVQSNLGRKRRNVQASNTKKCIKFDVGSLDGAEYGMSIVKFGLETGLEVDKTSLEKLKDQTQEIDHYELPEDGKGYITFYLSEIKPSKIPFIFVVKDTFIGDPSIRQPAAIEVYDYYNPDVKCLQYYSTGDRNFLDHRARCEGTVCSCLENVCLKDEQRAFVNQDNPAKFLENYTCDNKKASYAVFVNVTGMEFNDKSNINEATAKVDRVFHKGTEDLKKHSEMMFIFRPECTYLSKLFADGGNSFYIIGKDGYQVDDNGRLKYIYELMDTALVFKKPNNPRSRFATLIKRYEDFMKYGCST
uniref:Complement C3-2 isoform n=1 Tax=Sinonovacula constricta TaxID=98310 RepID=A0A2D1QTX2_SINCO|nr:complement C3-2 isoform [Sinonovacula constricta]